MSSSDQKLGVWLVVSVSAIVIIAMMAHFVLTVLTRDTRQDISLHELASDEIPGLAGMRQDTPGVCGEVPGCVQGAYSVEANFLRFDSRENASAFAEGSLDSYQSDWIVIEYRDTSLSQDEREFLESYLDSLATSD